ncbi:hypothetical protein B0H14DRAFT_3128372 [Mycena olivaceomarginata]|nr:hypothetical protein B0H14DRAFT_3128372 [Mycena olivaceomarginata]
MARQETGPRHVPPLDIVSNTGPDGLPRHAVLIAAIVVVCGSWLIKTRTGGDASSPEGAIGARACGRERQGQIIRRVAAHAPVNRSPAASPSQSFGSSTATGTTRSTPRADASHLFVRARHRYHSPASSTPSPTGPMLPEKTTMILRAAFPTCRAGTSALVRAQAMCVIAATPTPEEEAEFERKRAREQQRKEDLRVAHLAMAPVAAQICALGRRG